jgi:hypothetical protein
MDAGGSRGSYDRAGEALHRGGLPHAGVLLLLATSSFLVMELYAAFAPTAAAARLGEVRTWIDSHLDQAIIAGSLVVGFWLVGNSIYLIVS